MPAPLVLAGVAAKRMMWRRIRRVLLVLLPMVGIGVLAVTLLVALAGGSSSQAPLSTGCPGSSLVSAVSVPGLTPQQVGNARTIVAVGRELGVPAYGWVIAVATAMQESSLVNLPNGDRDSVGLFQQRAAWGSTPERMDPTSAAQMFYTGGHGGQPGLLQIPDFEHLPLSEAAQAVQRSAFPNAYAKWQPLAVQIVGDPTVLSASCYSNIVFAGDGSAGSQAVAAALSVLGTPYSWGGGSINGPSVGFGAGAGVVGFDCSSLAQYAWHQAGVDLPRVASAQAAALPHVPLNPSAWHPGDLVFFHAPGDPPAFYHHVGIYDGQGSLVHTPRPGLTVEVVHDFLTIPFFDDELAAVGRPGPPSVANGPAGGGEKRMDDHSPAAIDREFGSLVEGLVAEDRAQSDGTDWQLAIRVERLGPGVTPTVGARARFLMTTYDEREQLVAHGWRTDLRIRSEAISQVPGLKQSGIQLVDEQEHYTGRDGDGVIVEISRVWVERLVAIRRLDGSSRLQDTWLQSILEDANKPIVEPLHPVARRHHLTGARVVHDLGDGRFEHDLRAVSPALMGEHGKLMVAVVSEAHWYRWPEHDYDLNYRPVRALPADMLWVE